MARIGINTGSAANDNTGSTLRAAGGIINDNFLEIYTRFGDGTNLTSIGGTWTSTSVGIHTLKNVGIGTTNPTSALTVTGNGTFTGVVTATTFIGALTGTASTATLATNAQGLTGTPNITVGVVTVSRLNVGTSGTVITTTASGLVGIGTTNPRFTLEVGAVGASGTTLFVNGDARITGIVTIGSASITLNGTTNIINVGTGITINGSTGIISATSIVLGGTTLTGAAVTSITAGSGISVNQSTGNVTITATGGGGSSQWVTTVAGIHTLSNVGIGTTNPTSALTVTGNGIFTGVVTATTFIGALTGTATSTTNIPNLTGDIISNGTSASLGSFTSTALRTALTSSTGTGDAVFATSPTFATPALGTPASGTLTNCTFPTLNQNTTGTAGGLSGTPNITVGVVTATTLNVGTSGTIITTTTAGLVGIGTTNPTSALTVKGNTSLETLNISGISTLGTVQISSGIVTATSGIVTYYGDTSNAADGRWTLGASGSAHYTFTGIGFTQTTNDPILYLTRGRVYEFVNNSGGSHPFQIRTNYSGTAYSAGVTNNGAASGTIRFEVPFSAPNTLYYQCTNHAGMGATIFVTKSSDLISVKDFGALGDGSSDDTTFIQNAVNSISATGGTIYFPQGVYRITAPITISNNTSTYGEGQASVIRPGVGVTAIFQYSNTSNVNVEKLQFDGVNTTTLTALYFPGGINNSFVYVSDCFFATMNTAIEMATDSYIVANNYAIDANTFLYGSNAALNGSVSSNYVLGGQYSVRLRSIGGNQAEGVRIYDNTFLNTSSTALSVFIQSALEVEIFNNIIDQVGTSGYSIYASPESGDTIASIKATNNWCDSGNGGGSIYFYDCNQVIVDSNTFNSSSGIGTALTIQNTNTFFATKNICLNAFTNAASYTSSTNQYQSGNIYSASVGAATTFERNVFENDLAVGVSSARGVILTSPNGTKYRLHVSNAGTVNTVLVS